MATKTALSSVDVVRKFVYEHQPVTLEPIAAELKAQMSSLRTDEQAVKSTQLVLDKNPYFRRNAAGEWEIEPTLMPEYKVLQEVLKDAHQVLYEREVKAKVARKLGMKVASVVLDMFRADGVKRFGASRWGLSDWVLANDQAAEVLKAHQNGLSEKDLLKHVSERFTLNPENVVFNLISDKRFVAERKLWLLKEFADKKKEAPKAKAATKRKEVSLDTQLETGFIQAQVARAGEEEDSGERLMKSRLRKATIKQAQEIVEAREDLAPKPEDFAARLSQMLSASGGGMDLGVRSFQRVEDAPKERGLAQKERDEINQFIAQLMEQDSVGVAGSAQSIANAPLSARKMQDVLRLKYINYTRDRAVVPSELYRFLVELLRPNLSLATLHPACMEGLLSVELFTYLYDRLEDAAWALTEDNRSLEIVQRDGQRYRLSADDPQLIEQARDRFIVTQVDLLNHYLLNRYTGIESDKVLARAARVVTRLSGFENAYIVSRDFLSELPEVFGFAHDEENLIPETFELVLSNITFTADHNLAAAYLEQSLRVLTPGGKLGAFVLTDLLALLKEHALLGDFLRGMAVTHLLRMPLVEGRYKVAVLVIEALPGGGRSDRPIAYAEVEDLRGLNQLAVALRDAEPGNAFKLVDANALGTLI